MEPPQHQHHHHQADQVSCNNSNKSGSGGYTCRQTRTRWTPTTEQIKILEDLYYNSGGRSPPADQIRKITARLRRHGKIEDMNVVYWFKNHRARERKKKRFNGTTMTTPSSSPNSVMMATNHYHQHHPLLHHHHRGVPMQRPANTLNVKLDQDHHLYHQNKSYPIFNNGNLNHASSGSECAGAVNASNGYMSSHVYGDMEQDCSLNYKNVGGGWANIDHNHHYSFAPYNFFDRPKPLFSPEGHQEEEEYGGDAYLEHRRTLPLFPMHGEDHINGIWKYGQSDGRDQPCGRGPCASLELSLN